MSKKNKMKISVFELIAYIVTLGLMAWGLTYMTLGLFARFLPVGNALSHADATIKSLFGLGYFWWGVIILLIGALLLVVVLIIYAKKNDRQVERDTRRAARLAQLKESTRQQQAEIIDAEVVSKPETIPASDKESK